MNANTEFYRINSDFFVWTGNKGVCDATDLPPEAPFHRSARESFDVVSSKTGEVRHFFYLTTLYNTEGDINGWRYRSNGGEFEIDIIND